MAWRRESGAPRPDGIECTSGRFRGLATSQIMIPKYNPCGFNMLREEDIKNSLYESPAHVQLREVSPQGEPWRARGLTEEAADRRSHTSTEQRVRRVLAVASGGGHWVQLQRLRPALEHHDVVFVTTHPGYKSEVAPHRFYAVNDASRTTKLALLVLAIRMLAILIRERPDVVISTGAAPGYFALRLGRMLGARTIWIDSIANVDEMSMAGRLAKPYADLWLTQWPHLASEQGPTFAGAVL